MEAGTDQDRIMHSGASAVAGLSAWVSLMTEGGLAYMALLV